MTQIYAQVNLAMKSSINGKEIKDESEKLIIELAEDMRNLKDIEPLPNKSANVNTEGLNANSNDGGKNNIEDFCSIHKENFPNLVKIEKQEEELFHEQRKGSYSKNIIAKFDDYFSDVDVEYL